MARTFLVTCGTSILSRYVSSRDVKNNPKRSHKELLKLLDIKDDKELEAALKEFVRPDIEKGQHGVSAEISTLYAIGLQRNDNVFLFGSNTEDSEVCMKVMRDLLQKDVNSIEIEKIKRLSAAKGDLVMGLGELANALSKRCLEYRESGEVCFVVTGGYKAMTTLASVVAMLMGCNSFYLYEGSDVAGNIGILPLALSDERLPDEVSRLCALPKGKTFAELRAIGLSEAEIHRYFAKEGNSYLVSPLVKLANSNTANIPRCPSKVPVIIAEGSKAHRSIWDKNLSSIADIPDRKAIAVLEMLSRALVGFAEHIALGEYHMKLKGDYRLRYMGIIDGHAVFSLIVPQGCVKVSVLPLDGKNELLDNLCNTWR